MLTSLLAAAAMSSIHQDPTWEELRETYTFPAWYTEAGFGIWVHWGAQTHPDSGGGWYARHMYQEDVGTQTWGSNAYAYHNKTYGHPSGSGYMEVLNDWKAENLDADHLVEYFKSLGAKYFVALANHHDHFDNWDSTHHPWNSVDIGPKKDIIREFRDAATKHSIPFGASSHDDRFLSWWTTAFGADTNGPKKGVPYDGHKTKADGKGKWWEGLDPADLYGLPPEKRPSDYRDKIGHNYMLRHQELVTRYDLDMIWYDGYGFPYEKYGVEVSRTLLNDNFKKKGSYQAVVVGKISSDPMVVRDIENGTANEIVNVPWQGILTMGAWFHKPDVTPKRDPRTVIEMLADINSKGGNLLLNVDLLSDGSIPPARKRELDEIGSWVNLNSAAIYGTKPWKVFGDNLDSIERRLENNATEADLKALEELRAKGNDVHFNARTVDSHPFGPDEVRFTTKGDKLYVIVMNPSAGTIKIPALGRASAQRPGAITSISLIGGSHLISFKQDAEALELTVPAERPNGYAAVFEVSGAL